MKLRLLVVEADPVRQQLLVEIQASGCPFDNARFYMDSTFSKQLQQIGDWLEFRLEEASLLDPAHILVSYGRAE
jgi:hypothetical protein